MHCILPITNYRKGFIGFISDIVDEQTHSESDSVGSINQGIGVVYGAVRLVCHPTTRSTRGIGMTVESCWFPWARMRVLSTTSDGRAPSVRAAGGTCQPASLPVEVATRCLRPAGVALTTAPEGNHTIQKTMFYLIVRPKVNKDSPTGTFLQTLLGNIDLPSSTREE